MKRLKGLFGNIIWAFIFPFFIPLLFVSCDRGMEQDFTTQLYKLKSNYLPYVQIELSPDKKVITSVSGAKESSSLKLIQGYHLNGTMGVNTAFLSLTYEEYSPKLLGVDSLYKYIMEADPFIEYYTSENLSLWNFEEESGGMDTILINNLIRENRITDFFVQLK